MIYKFIRALIIFIVIILQSGFSQNVGSDWVDVEGENDKEVKAMIKQEIIKLEKYTVETIKAEQNNLKKEEDKNNEIFEDKKNRLQEDYDNKSMEKNSATIKFNRIIESHSRKIADQKSLERDIAILDSSIIKSRELIEQEKIRVKDEISTIPLFQFMFAKVKSDANSNAKTLDDKMFYEMSKLVIEDKIGVDITSTAIVENEIMTSSEVKTFLGGKVSFSDSKSHMEDVVGFGGKISHSNRYLFGLAQVYPLKKKGFYKTEPQNTNDLSVAVEIIDTIDDIKDLENLTNFDTKQQWIEKKIDKSKSKNITNISRINNIAQGAKDIILGQEELITEFNSKKRDKEQKLKPYSKEIKKLEEERDDSKKNMELANIDFEKIKLEYHNHVLGEQHLLIKRKKDEKENTGTDNEQYTILAIKTFKSFNNSVQSQYISKEETVSDKDYNEREESKKVGINLTAFKILGKFSNVTDDGEMELNVYVAYKFGFKFEDLSKLKEESEKQAYYQKLKYNLKIMSYPSGATVFEEFDNFGITPLEIYLEAGDYDLIIKKAGYRDKIESINVSEYQLTSKHIRLIKDSSKMTESSKKKEKPSSKQDLSEKDPAEKNYLIGVGASIGLPALVNLNARIATNVFNFEYATDIYSLTGDSLSESEGVILGKQFSVGLGDHTVALNYIWGHTEFYGIEAYPALYGAENNVYEYQGVTLKGFQKYYFWEIGANWGDEQFYGGKAQFYFQLGTMLDVRF